METCQSKGLKSLLHAISFEEYGIVLPWLLMWHRYSSEMGFIDKIYSFCNVWLSIVNHFVRGPQWRSDYQVQDLITG